LWKEENPIKKGEIHSKVILKISYVGKNRVWTTSHEGKNDGGESHIEGVLGDLGMGACTAITLYSLFRTGDSTNRK